MTAVADVLRIYSYEFDLDRQVQPGDSFKLLYGIDGGEHDTLLAAEFDFEGATHKLYRFRTTDGAVGPVNISWFKPYRDNELPDKFDVVVQSWDCANKPTESSDYSVCTTIGEKDKRKYLMDVWRKQVDYPDLNSNFSHY